MKALVQKWPRLFELLLGLCLLAAPWVLHAPPALRAHDACVATLMLSVTAWSMVQPERLVNLWNLLVAAWLTGFALLFSRTWHSATAQSELLVGLTLALFAIIPSRTMDVPAAWRSFFADNPQLVEEERQAVASHQRASD